MRTELSAAERSFFVYGEAVNFCDAVKSRRKLYAPELRLAKTKISAARKICVRYCFEYVFPARFSRTRTVIRKNSKAAAIK